MARGAAAEPLEGKVGSGLDVRVGDRELPVEKVHMDARAEGSGRVAKASGERQGRAANWQH